MINNENLVCKSLEQVNLLKDFFEFIFAKKSHPKIDLHTSRMTMNWIP